MKPPAGLCHVRPGSVLCCSKNIGTAPTCTTAQITIRAGSLYASKLAAARSSGEAATFSTMASVA